MRIFAFIALCILAVAVSFGVTALLVWLVSLLIPAVVFSWKLALIVWAIIFCLRLLFDRLITIKYD